MVTRTATSLQGLRRLALLVAIAGSSAAFYASGATAGPTYHSRGAQLPTLAAVVAMIVGYQASVTCTPLPQTTPGFTLLGWTQWNAAGDGSIELAPIICMGWEDARDDGFDLSEPDVDTFAGGALLVAVHEAEHLRYLDGNEALTECRAMRDYSLALNYVFGPWQLFSFESGGIATLLKQGAAAMNAAMPPEYHGGTC